MKDRGCDRGRTKSRLDLLKAIDSEFEDKDILEHDYTKAQALAFDKEIGDRVAVRVGRSDEGIESST